MKKILAFSFLTTLIISEVYSQTQPLKFIKVHFLYGSKPLKRSSTSEGKWFGGIHGGHVEIELDSMIVGFLPAGKFHIFPSSKEKHSAWSSSKISWWLRDTAGMKYLSVLIPVTEEQLEKLKGTQMNYRDDIPYDYAFFGYRCAAATYDLLEDVGVVREKRNFTTVIRYFYPRKLRTYLVKLSDKRSYHIITHEGRGARKWERDTRRTKKRIGKLRKRIELNLSIV